MACGIVPKTSGWASRSAKYISDENSTDAAIEEQKGAQSARRSATRCCASESPAPVKSGRASGAANSRKTRKTRKSVEDQQAKIERQEREKIDDHQRAQRKAQAVFSLADAVSGAIFDHTQSRPEYSTVKIRTEIDIEDFERPAMRPSCRLSTVSRAERHQVGDDQDDHGDIENAAWASQFRPARPRCTS